MGLVVQSATSQMDIFLPNVLPRGLQIPPRASLCPLILGREGCTGPCQQSGCGLGVQILGEGVGGEGSLCNLGCSC